MKTPTIVITTIFILGGCSYNHIVKSPQEFNHNFDKHSADIILNNGDCYEARWIMSNNDSLTFVTYDNDALQHLPIRAVRCVKTTNHWSGALRGLLLGLVGGGVVSGALTAGRKSTGSDSDEANRVIVMVGFAIITGSGATIYGGIHGDQSCYEFTSDSSSRSTDKSVAP